MTSRNGLSVFLDVNFYDNPKVVAAGERADRLYTQALCLVKRTWSDGFVSDAQIAKMGLSGWRKRAAKLEEVGLFHRDDNRTGWWIHDFLDVNRSRAQQDEIVAKRAAAGRKGGRPKTNQVAKQVANQSVKQDENPVVICSDLFCSDLFSSATPQPPATPDQPNGELAAAAVADSLIQHLGYFDQTPGPDLIRYTARALDRGWTQTDLEDAAVEVAAMNPDEIETTPLRVLRGILKDRANRDAPPPPPDPATTTKWTGDPRRDPRTANEIAAATYRPYDPNAKDIYK